MHSGPFALLRMWLFYAKPWQQLLICVSFVIVGALLIAFVGHPSGAVVIAFGALFGVRIVRARGRTTAPAAEPADPNHPRSPR